MTIHRAKGLEFPVVCVADLGRLGRRRRARGCCSAHDGTVGLRLAPLGGGDVVPALAYERLAAEEDRADAEEERRLLYVAMTRARERLILSGGADGERWPEPRPGGAPLDWIVRAIAGGEPRDAVRRGGATRRDVLERSWDGRVARACAAAQRAGHARRRCCRERRSRPTGGRAAGAPATALPKAPKVMPAPPVRAAAGAAAAVLHRAAGVRPLRLPLLPPARARAARASRRRRRWSPTGRATGWTRACAARSSTRCWRSSTSRGPRRRPPRTSPRSPPRHGVELTADDVEDIRGLVGAFAASPLCERLAGAARVRREAGFAFALEPGGGGSLVNGFVDVIAPRPDGARLIVDYKTDRLDGRRARPR